MGHDSNLIATVAIGLTVAFAGGFLARRIGLPPIVGYLLGGVAVGPFTPGFIADVDVAAQLAEIGVILLMFGVGIHFSIRDLLAVRRIAVPGAIGQIAVATALGVALAIAMGWHVSEGLILGLAVSVASTVVLLRALLERHALESIHGRIAVGWLIVEDLFTVLALVLLPALAIVLGGESMAGSEAATSPLDVLTGLAGALAKAALLGGLMFVLGGRAVPWLLVQVARDGSRELFTLSVLAVALGVAFIGSEVFGVSLALGAFLAGAVVGESDLSHQAAADALPLRDAFAVLFFVSVGMLVDPGFVVAMPLAVVGIVAVIVVGKALVAFLIVAAFGYPIRTGLTVAAGLAQIGEFSFILARLGNDLALLPDAGVQLVVAGSLLSITLNPFLFAALDTAEELLRRRPGIARALQRRAGVLGVLDRGLVQEGPRGHAVLCGYGRVGSVIGRALERRGFRYVVIELDRRRVEELRARGIPAISGDASSEAVLEQVGLDRATVLVLAIPDPPAARLALEYARRINPRIEIIARTHSDGERAALIELGARQAILGERELAIQMARFTLRRFGVSAPEVEAIAQGLRAHG
jgi:monovalent cation:H+ antiporter-2, CPA2 family